MPPSPQNFDDSQKTAHDLRRQAIVRLNSDFDASPTTNVEKIGEPSLSPEQCCDLEQPTGLSRTKTISGWWIPFGVAISIGADHFKLKWLGYRSEHVGFVGMLLVLICFVLLRSLGKQRLRQNPFELLFHAIFVALLVMTGWVFGDYLVILVARIR